MAIEVIKTPKLKASNVSSNTINMTIEPENYDFNNNDHRITIDVISSPKEESKAPVNGKISPGTNDETFPGQKYVLDDETKKELIAAVYSEASESDYLESDAMGVTSVILNRCEDKSGIFENTVHNVIFQPTQFEGTTKTKYEEAMKDPSCVQPEMIDAINRVLNGERNTDALYFVGRNEYNEFRKDF